MKNHFPSDIKQKNNTNPDNDLEYNGKSIAIPVKALVMKTKKKCLLRPGVMESTTTVCGSIINYLKQ